MTKPVLIELPAEPSAVVIARNFVAEHGSGLDPDLLEDAVLLVSELVSNAVRHGRPTISMQVRNDPPGIGVEVADRGPGMPWLADQDPDVTQASGRGLRMVAALASDWGVSQLDDGPGKMVWFRLRPSQPA